MDYDELFPNRFMKAGEFKGKDVTLKISGVQIEELEGDGGKKVKGIISFDRTPKQLVLNKTNGLCLKALFGRRTEDWVGKRVTFYPAQIDNFGDVDLAIRVRGSPDIAGPVQVEIKLAKKKPKTVTLQKTAGAAAPGKKAEVPAQPPPPVDEPPEDVVLPGQTEPGAEG